MSWFFCPQCHATLKIDSTGRMECDVCDYQSNLNELKEQNKIPSITTYSMEKPTPTWAKTDAEQALIYASTQSGPVRATIEEPCIRCGHPEVGYYTLQIRSVDEGSTVFYECPACKFHWSINN